MDAPSSEQSPPRAGLGEWLGLAVLALPSLFIALDVNALFLALPRLSADLGATGTEQLWIMDIYGFVLAGFLVTMGTLGDRIGRRKLLMVGASALGVASVLAAFSTSPEMLIATRALMGLAAATLMPSTLALISNMFRDEYQRGTAIAIWATTQFAGAALGPVVTGLLLEYFWWGSVFLLNVPIMALLLATGTVLLPEFRNPDAGRLDLVSVALSLAAILPIIYGMKQLAVEAGTVFVPISTILLGAIFGFVFVRRQLRLTEPLLDLGLFARPSFTAVLTALMFVGAALGGTGFMVTQYLQSVLGFSPALAALWFAPMGLAIAVGTMFAPAIAARAGTTKSIAFGLLISATGFIALARVEAEGGLAIVVVGIVVAALGTGPLFALGTNLVVGSAPPERAGSAASLSETSNQFGANMGFAVLGSIGAAIYRYQMADSTPEGVSADATQSARETLAGAVATAGDLPTGAGSELLLAARGAFTSGLNATGFIGVFLFVALAILVAFLIREVPSGNPSEQSDGSDEAAGVPTPAADHDPEEASVKT